MGDLQFLDLVQTLAIVVGLLMTRSEIKSRNQVQKFQNYLNSISGSVELGKMVVENPVLQSIYDYTKENWSESEYRDLKPEQKSQAHYCDQVLSLLETVWYANKGNLLETGEWKYWKRWAEELNKSPAFRWTLGWVQKEGKDYDTNFLKEVDSKHKELN